MWNGHRVNTVTMWNGKMCEHSKTMKTVWMVFDLNIVGPHRKHTKITLRSHSDHFTSGRDWKYKPLRITQTIQNLTCSLCLLIILINHHQIWFSGARSVIWCYINVLRLIISNNTNLNTEIIVVIDSGVDDDSKEWELRVDAEECDLRPNDDQWEH